jgi:hypothetical protein
MLVPHIVLRHEARIPLSTTIRRRLGWIGNDQKSAQAPTGAGPSRPLPALNAPAPLEFLIPTPRPGRGGAPLTSLDNADTLSQIIERDAVEPRKVNARVPKDLETIVLKCLRKDAGDR